MGISKPVKILIGFFTAFIVLLYFLVVLFLVMVFMSDSGSSKILSPFIMVLAPLLICFPIVQWGLLIFYIIHEIKNKALTDTSRILFPIGTFLLPFVVMPIYFFAYLWKDNPQESQAVQA